MFIEAYGNGKNPREPLTRVPGLKIRVGINTGPVSGGDSGPEEILI